ncbi:mannuronate-specific alginate lyase [Solimonas terrae]|uniref:Mannuronate-specific alginate lyase n=2 Tax=Solimonas terrae TaxID=1396819 RepID=A0A6M2BRB8_9GAMM|nr:mannuronate-specific alginate lyase [Solimonas terrae]
MRRLALGSAVIVGCAIGPALADRLVPPPGYDAPVSHSGKSEPCPAAPPPFAGTLDFPSKYEGSDSARDTLNEDADRRYKMLTAPITTMEKGATRLVDAYMDSGSPQTLDCVLGWYGSWADADALLGPAANHTGKSMRKWALASLSGAWLRLQFSSSQPLAAQAQRAATIEAWLGRIATQVRSEWSEDDPLSKINNHYYWAAWAVMATSVVTDRRDLFDWASGMYAIFARQVDADGYLPNEIKRQTRAAGYQVYAVTPVAMLAAFGKANHVDLASEGHDALQRAAERAVGAYDDPRAYEARTGKRQVLEGADEQRSKLAWLEAYCWTVPCTGAPAEKLASLRPLKNTRLGGDQTAIYR